MRTIICESKSKLVRQIGFLVLSLLLLGCSPDSPYERRPGWFQRPTKAEVSGSFQYWTYRQRTRTSYPFSVVEILGKEIPLKNAHIRYPSICYDCPNTGSEAIAFQLFSGDEQRRGTWVVQVTNNELRYFHIGSTNGVEGRWNKTSYANFDAESSKCIPDDCISHLSLPE